MKHFIILILTLVISSCSVKSTADYGIARAQRVSMIQLIANPEKFDGEKVMLQCYFTMGHRENVLYLSKIDYDNTIFKNGIWLSVSKEFVVSQHIEPPYEGYIDIEGTFIKNKPKSPSFFSGTLTDITYMERLYQGGGEKEN